jgi:AcrR family transcriptional regulator
VTIKLDERPGPIPSDLLTLAKRRFMNGERLDINALAEALGVSRATAYRWAGNVDELTDRVIASLAADTFQHSFRNAKGEGTDRLIDAIRRGLRDISRGPYRVWLSSEDPEKALRIVASKFGTAQGTTMRLWEQRLAEEVEAGRLHLPVDPHTMAYAIVRISESFLYADLIAGEEPDIDSCIAILKLLLR